MTFSTSKFRSFLPAAAVSFGLLTMVVLAAGFNRNVFKL